MASKIPGAGTSDRDVFRSLLRLGRVASVPDAERWADAGTGTEGASGSAQTGPDRESYREISSPD